MRQIVLDTETTGLEVSDGHRIIEIGCVELVDRRVTGKYFHVYINPEREVDEGAFNVHGISNEFLSDKPRFDEVREAFLTFIDDSELIIHNAPFDLGFLNDELRRQDASFSRLEITHHILDTLALARKKHPRQKNNLDALCKRYDIDNSNRELHGALLDAEILAFVYLAMTGGQKQLFQAADSSKKSQTGFEGVSAIERSVPLTVIKANDAELKAHDAFLQLIDKQSGGHCTWQKLND